MAYEDGNGSLDDIQPLPRAVPTLAGKASQDTSGNEITESTRNERAGIEYGHTERQLFPGIPF